MKKRIVIIICVLLITIISIFFGNYANYLIPIFLNTYQSLFDKKSVKLSKFDIHVPKDWFIAEIDKKKNELVISSIPASDNNYTSCFIVVKTINFKNKSDYEKIVAVTDKINQFHCKYLDNTGKCIGNLKEKSVLFLFTKDCNINNFYSFVRQLYIN